MALLQVRGATFTTVTSATLAYSNPVVQHSGLFAATRDAAGVSVTVSDNVNTASNWTDAFAGPVPNGGGQVSLHYKEDTGVGTPTVSWTLGSATTIFVEIGEWSTVNTSASLDKTASATGTSTAILSAATAATAQANELWLGVGTAGAAVTFSQSGAWAIPTGTGAPTARMTFVWQEVTATGTPAAAVTIDTSQAWIALTATFKQTPVAGATPPPPPAMRRNDPWKPAYDWMARR